MLPAFVVFSGRFKVTVRGLHLALLGSLFLVSGILRHFEGKLTSSLEDSLATVPELFSEGIFSNSVGRPLLQSSSEDRCNSTGRRWL